ncbi:hypothetical protein Q3C01_13530 [Bradyrhizobium sp. UFLA05-109]
MASAAICALVRLPLDLLRETSNLVGLLAVVLAGPDADTAIDGMHQVVLQIGARLDLIKERLECGSPSS